MQPQLPNELLGQVFEKVTISPVTGSEKEFRSSQHALSRICRSCKLFNQVATPLLYRAYSKPAFPGRDALGPFNTTTTDAELYGQPTRNIRDMKIHRRSVQNTRCFLRMLLLRPELCTHVTELVLYDWQLHHRAVSHCTPLSAPLAQLYMSTATRLSIGNDCSMSAWMKALQTGDEDAEIALLLSLVPNLATLKLGPWMEYSRYRHLIEQRCLPSVSTNELTTTTPLGQLRNLHLGCGDMKNRLCPIDLHCIMHLPHLETLTIDNIIPDTCTAQTCPTTGQSTVHNLRIQNGSIDNTTMRHLLDSCKSLRKFEYEFDPETYTTVETP